MTARPAKTEPRTIRIELQKATARFLRDADTERDVSADTLRWYTQKLAQLASWAEVTYVDELDRDRLLDFIGELKEKGRSPHYTRGWFQIFRTFFGWARRNQYAIHPSLISQLPDERWFTIAKPRELEPDFEVYSAEDLKEIEAAASNHRGWLGRRNQVFLWLLGATGVRLSEALGLTDEDVLDRQLRLRGLLRRQKGEKPRAGAKGRKGRVVPLDELDGRGPRILERWLEHERPDVAGGWIFPSEEGGQWSSSAVYSLMGRIARETRLRVHAHGFRHTFATNHLKKYGDIDRLRRILGHTTYRQTSAYVKYAGLDLVPDLRESPRPVARL